MKTNVNHVGERVTKVFMYLKYVFEDGSHRILYKKTTKNKYTYIVFFTSNANNTNGLYSANFLGMPSFC